MKNSSTLAYAVNSVQNIVLQTFSFSFFTHSLTCLAVKRSQYIPTSLQNTSLVVTNLSSNIVSQTHNVKYRLSRGLLWFSELFTYLEYEVKIAMHPKNEAKDGENWGSNCMSFLPLSKVRSTNFIFLLYFFRFFFPYFSVKNLEKFQWEV